MGKKPSGKPTGRPQIQIDWQEFDKLCYIQCTRREIADWFDCSEDTIERACLRDKGLAFALYFDQKKGTGKISLRRKQYEIAMGGNIAMLIWLGKQYLMQSDKVEQKSEVNNKIEMVYESEWGSPLVLEDRVKIESKA
jgi:hypothetical protein